MPRPRRTEDLRAAIVREALLLLDEEGAAGLSIRKLGARMGMRGPSLYHYFATKEAILDAINDHISDSIEVGEHDSWEQSLRAFGSAYRAAMAHHPYAVALLVARPVTSPANPATLRLYERQMRRLIAFGWEPAPAWRALMSVEALVLGDAMQAGAPAFEIGDEGVRRDCALIVSAIDELGPAAAVDGNFELGLEALIAGIASARATAVRD